MAPSGECQRARAAVSQVSFDSAWRQLGGVMNLTGWAEQVEEMGGEAG